MGATLTDRIEAGAFTEGQPGRKWLDAAMERIKDGLQAHGYTLNGGLLPINHGLQRIWTELVEPLGSRTLATEAVLATYADKAMAEALVLADAHAEALARKLDLEAAKPIEKHEAVLRIMDAQKVAYTNAEKQVEGEERYAGFLKQYRDAVVAELKAYSRASVARLRADAAVRRIG